MFFEEHKVIDKIEFFPQKIFYQRIITVYRKLTYYFTGLQVEHHPLLDGIFEWSTNRVGEGCYYMKSAMQCKLIGFCDNLLAQSWKVSATPAGLNESCKALFKT